VSPINEPHLAPAPITSTAAPGTDARLFQLMEGFSWEMRQMAEEIARLQRTLNELKLAQIEAVTIEKLNMQPGDTLVFHWSGRMTERDFDELTERFKRFDLGPIMVLEDDAKLSVLHREETT